jgi:DNA-binding Lrp family transcriptional regulator
VDDVRQPRVLDPIDRTIVAALRRNGRASVAQLADEASVSRSTAHERLTRLIRTGVITGFHAAVDHTAVGEGLSAVLFIDVDQHAWQSVRARLLEIDGIEHVLFLTGRHDLLAVVRCVDLAMLRDVILLEVQAVEGVRSSETAVVLDELWPRR